MISRCPLGLPIRERKDEGNIDYSDSAFLSGMLSLFGSKEEKLHLHIKDNGLVRHPVAEPSRVDLTLPESTSRDQLVAWSSTKSDDPEVNKIRLKYAQNWFINADILPPQVRLYLYKQAQAKAPLWLVLVGYLVMFVDIILFCLRQNMLPVYDPKTGKKQHEINQILCLCNSYGKWALWLFFKLHKSPDENMKDYYTRWRGQEEIYEMYIKWKESL